VEDGVMMRMKIHTYTEKKKEGTYFKVVSKSCVKEEGIDLKTIKDVAQRKPKVEQG